MFFFCVALFFGKKSIFWKDDIAHLKETVAHYNRKHIDVHCALVDLSKAYERLILSSLCNK